MIWLKTFGRPGVECDDLKENCRGAVPTKNKKKEKNPTSLQGRHVGKKKPQTMRQYWKGALGIIQVPKITPFYSQHLL